MANHIGPRQQFQIDEQRRQFDALERQFYGLCSAATTHHDQSKLQKIFVQMQEKANAIPHSKGDYEYALLRAEDSLHSVALALFSEKGHPVVKFEQTTGPLPLELLTHVLTFASDGVHGPVSRDYHICNPHVARALQEEFILNVNSVLALIDEMQQGRPVSPSVMGARASIDRHLKGLDDRPITSPEKLAGVTLGFSTLLATLFKESCEGLSPDVQQAYREILQNQLQIPLLRHKISLALPYRLNILTLEETHALVIRIKESIALNDIDSAIAMAATLRYEPSILLAFRALSPKNKLTPGQIRDIGQLFERMADENTKNMAYFLLAKNCLDNSQYLEGLLVCSLLTSFDFITETNRYALVKRAIKGGYEAGLDLINIWSKLPSCRMKDRDFPDIAIPYFMKIGEWRSALRMIHQLEGYLQYDFCGNFVRFASEQNCLEELFTLNSEITPDINDQMLCTMLGYLARTGTQVQDKSVHWLLLKLIDNPAFSINVFVSQTLLAALKKISDPILQSEASFALLKDHLSNGHLELTRDLMSLITVDPWLSDAKAALSQFATP